MTRHVFTYGSLMFAPVWTRVVVGAYRALPATLADHARHAVSGEDYPGMVESVDGSVAGLAYLDVDDDDLARLDRFEGADYARRSVSVACADGVARDAETYLYLPRAQLQDAGWDPGAFAMERFLATYCRDKLG